MGRSKVDSGSGFRSAALKAIAAQGAEKARGGLGGGGLLGAAMAATAEAALAGPRVTAARAEIGAEIGVEGGAAAHEAAAQPEPTGRLNGLLANPPAAVGVRTWGSNPTPNPSPIPNPGHNPNPNPNPTPTPTPSPHPNPNSNPGQAKTRRAPPPSLIGTRVTGTVTASSISASRLGYPMPKYPSYTARQVTLTLTLTLPLTLTLTLPLTPTLTLTLTPSPVRLGRHAPP